MQVMRGFKGERLPELWARIDTSNKSAAEQWMAQMGLNEEQRKEALSKPARYGLEGEAFRRSF